MPGNGVGSVASMWPRSDDRGKRLFRVVLAVVRVASMWPRSDDRGKGLFTRTPPVECHCFNVAAVR